MDKVNLRINKTSYNAIRDYLTASYSLAEPELKQAIFDYINSFIITEKEVK